MNKISTLILLFAVSSARAQAPAAPAVCAPPPSTFSEWLGCQKAYAGVGYLVQHDGAKYATTSYSLVQYGRAGLNVAQPSNNLDMIDVAPMIAAANQRRTRYGISIPIHGGNIWNSVRFSEGVESHINRTALPNFIVAYAFLLPDDGHTILPLKYLRPWGRDGMITATFGFGGTN